MSARGGARDQSAKIGQCGPMLADVLSMVDMSQGYECLYVASAPTCVMVDPMLGPMWYQIRSNMCLVRTDARSDVSVFDLVMPNPMSGPTRELHRARHLASM